MDYLFCKHSTFICICYRRNFLVCGLIYTFILIINLIIIEDLIELKSVRNYIIIMPCFILAATSQLVPKKEAFYLIAASEMGEKAIKSEEFKQLTEIINLELSNKIKSLNEKENK